ncbi:MAG: OsmC family protein [Alphaproteobacteria bacterium]|nr:OsmC family protein [Alphaproteobacteria bacterium]
MMSFTQTEDSPREGNSHGGPEHEIHVIRMNSHSSLAQRHGVEIAVNTDLAGGSDALNPAELLLAAMAGCMIKTIERTAPILNIAFTSAEISLTAKRRAHPPGFEEIRYEIRLGTLSNDHQLDLLNSNVRTYGLVTSLIASALTLTGRIHRLPN